MGTGETAVDKRDRDPCPCGENIPVRATDSEQDNSTASETLMNSKKKTKARKSNRKYVWEGV